MIKAFKLSERQADDILELRLRQLARLEGFRIEQELAELRKEQSALGKLLGSDAALRKLVGKEIEDDAKKYGGKDPRRTLIETAERATVELKVSDERSQSSCPKNGSVRARVGHGSTRRSCRSRLVTRVPSVRMPYGGYIVAVGSNGRVYSIPVRDLPSARGDGAPRTSLIDLLGTRLVAYIAGAPLRCRYCGHQQRFRFRCALGDMSSRQRAASSSSTSIRAQSHCARRPPMLRPIDSIACLSSAGACWCSMLRN